MALVLKDRVKEQTTTTGTGTITLGGAVSGFEAFSAVGDGNTTYYAIVHQTADEWEVGLGTYTAAGTTLSRDTILESSNSDAAVNFSAGTKDVFVTYPSDKAVYRDTADEVSVTRATSATFAASATFATSATNATTAINVDGGTVSATDGTFNTMTVVTSASVGGGFNVGGNVGIGTTSPNRLFEVNEASGDAYMRLIASDTGGGADTVFENLCADNVQSNYIYFGDLDDVNIGIIRYSHASDFMSFTVNASEAMRINSSGDVGIGTSSPGGDLHIQGAVGNQVRLYLTDGDATGTGNSLLISKSGTLSYVYDRQAGSSLAFGTADTERMRIDSSGRVGIGTSSPASTLTVSDGTASGLTPFGDTDLFLNSSGDNYLQFGSGSSSSSAIYFGDSADGDAGGIIYSHATDAMSFRANAAERMRIDSSGNVGIGTNSPASKLQVTTASSGVTPSASYDDVFIEGSGSAGITIGSGTAAFGGLIFADSGSAAAGFMTYDHNTDSLRLGVTANERMRITSTGNVGIGTSSPSQKLTIEGTDARIYLTGANTDIDMTGTADGQLSLDGNGYAFGIALNSSGANLYTNSASRDLIFGVNETEIMRITDSNVGIGTTSPSSAINGSLKALEISSAVGSAIRATDTAASTNIEIAAGIGSTYVWNTTNTPMKFGTNNAERMQIDSSGNVGIGTSSPGTPLHVEGAVAGNNLAVRVNNTDTSGYSTIQMGGTDAGIYRNGSAQTSYGGASSLNLITVGAHPIAFSTSNTPRVIITSSGSVGIGTSSPSYLTHLYSTSVEPKLVIEDASFGAGRGGMITGSWGGNGLRLDSLGAAGWVYVGGGNTSYIPFTIGTEKARFHNNGNFGLGTTSPAKQLEITKSARATITSLTDGATITPDFDAAQNFAVTLGGNRTLANPSNIDPGQTGSIFVVQDVTGGRTLSFGSYWKFAGGTAPTLSTGTSATDRIDYVVQTSTAIHAVASLNLS